MRQTTSVLDVVISAVLTAGIPEPCEAGEGRVAVIDGTLAPCWSWAGHRQLYSGKQHTTGHNHRVVCDLTGRRISDNERLSTDPFRE